MERFTRRLRSVRNDTENEEKSKKKLIIIIILAGLILILLVMLFVDRNRKKTYNAYEVAYHQAAGLNSRIQYMAYDSGYIVYDNDGASAYSADGKQKWNVAYVLSNPILSVCEPYTAIADKGGNTLCIVDQSGTVSRYSVNGKIAAVSVARQGVTAVITTENDRDHIYLYEPGSTSILVDVMTMTQSSGFPVTVALSPDGRKMATSYLAFEGSSLKSWVTFYNFGDVGQNYVDNMVGSYSFEALVPQIDFVTNNLVIVSRDNGIVFYSMSEIPKVIATEDFTGEIQSVFSDKSTTGLVIKDTANANKKRLLLYNNGKGKKILDTALDFEYSGIYISGEDVVFYSGFDMLILDHSGREKFKTGFTKNIRHIFRVDDKTRYIVVGDVDIDTIVLKQVKK